MLEKINQTGDIKQFNIEEQNQLAEEIRQYIITIKK